MKIYTRNGDKGETGLLYGGKVSKDSPLPEAYGTVDEAQAVLGLARTPSSPAIHPGAVLVGRYSLIHSVVATVTGSAIRMLE